MAEIKKHIPNALGFFRLLLGLLFFFFPHSYRLLVLVTAAVTDILDGYLARRWNARSQLGQILDPVADKVFVAAMALTFVIEARITLLQFVLISARDFVVAIGALAIYLSGRSREIFQVPSRPLGKATTVLQVSFLISVLLIGYGYWPIVIITGAFSIISAMDYIQHYFRHARGGQFPVEA